MSEDVRYHSFRGSHCHIMKRLHTIHKQRWNLSIHYMCTGTMPHVRRNVYGYQSQMWLI